MWSCTDLPPAAAGTADDGPTRETINAEMQKALQAMGQGPSLLDYMHVIDGRLRFTSFGAFLCVRVI